MVLDHYPFVKMIKLSLYVEQTKDTKVKLFKFKEPNLLFKLINLQRIKLMELHIKFQSILLMFLLLNLKKLKIEWQEFKKF
jgi:hypothetical protein